MKESNMYAEIYTILDILGIEYIDKIPSSLYRYIRSKKNNDYLCNINLLLPFEEQNIMNETIEYISFLNYKYWTTDDEKRELMEIYINNDVKHNEELRKIYNPDNIFKNNNKINGRIENQEEKNYNLPVEIKKQNIFEKLFSFIKRLLH